MNNWTLVLREAPGRSRTLELGEGSFLVGSEESADLCVRSAGVAPRHLRVRLGAGVAEVELLAGASGAFVNGSVLEGRRECVSPVRVELGGACLEMEVLAFDESGATQVIRHSHVVAGAGAFGGEGQAAEQTLRIRLPQKSGEAAGQALVVEILAGARDVLVAGDTAEAVEETGSETLVLNLKQEREEAGGHAVAQAGYRLEAEIARGGMGRIFEAHDSTLQRRVAVKVSAVVGAGGDDHFRMEAEVLARLAHPNIVPVHAFGATDTGRPFYAMKLVAGKTLKTILRELVARNPATEAHYTRERLLSVLCKVCDAVGFAHEEGFLHRDLKPENVMVGEFGEVLVMDWGLARRVPGRGAAGGIPEAVAAVQYVEGTPQYMSPEQAAGLALDERSDIYALGGMLYSILTLRPPVEGRSVEEVLEKVKRCEVSAITTRRVAPEVKGAPVLERGRVPEALRAITFKAMACEPRGRYARVADLVADIEAYQAGFATSAEEAGLGRQLLLLLRRNRVASALLGALLLSGIWFTARLARSERLARFHAREAQDNARKASRSAEEARESARVARANEQRAEAEKQKERRTAAQAQIALAEAAESDANGEEMQRVLALVPQDLRGQEWAYLNQRAESSDLTIEAKGGFQWVAWAAHPLKPGVLVALQADGCIRSVNLATGEQEDLMRTGSTGGTFENTLAVSGDARRVAVVSKQGARNPPGLLMSAEVYELATGKRLWKGGEVPEKGSWCVLLNQDGSLLLNTRWSATSSLEMTEVATGTPLWTRPAESPHERMAAVFTDPATVQVYSVKDGTVRLAARTGSELAPPAPLPLLRVPFNESQWAVSDQGRFLAFAQGDVCNFSLDAGAHMLSIRGGGPQLRIAGVDQGKTLAVLSLKSDQSQVLQFWTTATASLKRTIPVSVVSNGGGGWRDWGLFAHPTSGHLAVIRWNLMKVWNPLGGAQTPEKLRWEAPVGFLGSSSQLLSWPQTKQIDANRSQHWMRITDVRGEPGVAGGSVVTVGDPIVEQVSLSRNGERLVMHTWANSSAPGLQVFNRTPGGGFERTHSGPLVHRPWPLQFALNPKGTLLWTGGAMLHAANGDVFCTVNRRIMKTLHLARCPPVWLDDSTLVEAAFFDTEEAFKQYGFRGRALVVWKAEQQEAALVVPAPDVSFLALSPDGTKIAEGGRDMRVRIRDVRTLQVEQSLRVHDALVTGIEWHPTQPLLATCSDDCSVKIWDLSSESLVERYGFYDTPVEKVLWSPDGLELCAAFKRGASLVYRPKVLQPDSGKTQPAPAPTGGN